MKKLLCSEYRYYYQQLCFKEKKIYDEIVNGLTSFRKRIATPGIHREQVERIMRYIELDIPEIFYLKSYQMVVSSLNKVIAILPQFRFTEIECINILNCAEREISTLINYVIDKDNYTKEKEIHDYLIKKSMYKDIAAPYSHEMPGAILYGISVCEGITKAFKFIADRAGLESVCVYGETTENGKSELHAWNKVKINSNFYNVDVTFNQSCGKNMNRHIRYDYFNVSDEFMKNRRAFDNPPCAGMSNSYYCNNDLYAFGKSDLKRIIANSLRINEWFSFQTPVFAIQDNEMYMVIVNELKNVIINMNGSNHTFEVIPNYNTGVFSVLLL